jgi:DNA-binding NtrC family response regulator
MLESIGYAVTGMTSSLDALERIRDDPHAFDLVVTDKTMPGLPGDRLAVEILGIRPDMPIMLCTGYGTETTEARAMAIGIKVVATKPIAIKAFGALVREALAPDPKAEA